MMRRLLLLLEESGISHKHRIKYASLATLVIILIFTLSSYQSITQEEAIALLKQFSELIQGRLTPYGIFLNNFLIALAMVIPVVGVGVAGFIIYQTGLVVSAMSVLSGVPALILVLIPFITFYGIPEMLAYGVAVSESVILTGQIIRGRFRGELKVLPLVIGVILILLVVASLVEYLLLVAIGELAGEMGIEMPV
ncbi:MAG TPA: hypothetical protein EYH45_01480 [Candidatus Caldiarchaeum subterraneum]|uniref:Stage II sporulation protein M n=1 Tax=Caldiarchaeum subterraneum TaxID=311458 RepID=A0A832ZUT0_CALS0|nr:hypothetical protein [Aigarchaeota archaeon]HIQ29216.1 hypothetical protein [Candidatus Caldarchaeum subterraneum]